jgi:ABC-type antimicrobial peptide transport system permease subunit
MALSSVRGAKWRSMLTMTGVIVGIIAVVTVVGIGEGVKRQVSQQLTNFGQDLVTVRPGKPAKDMSVTAATQTDTVFGMGTTLGLSANDVDVVRKSGEAKAVAPLGTVPGVVQVGDQAFANTPVIATSPDLPVVLNQKIEFGDFWNDGNDEGTTYTAVIGKNVAANLFEENVPLGRTFMFRGQSFVVRGVLADFSNVPFSPTASFDNAIFLPYRTAAAMTNNNAALYAILVKPVDSRHVDDTVKGVSQHLRDAHGGQKDVAVLGPNQTADSGNGVVKLLTTWIIAVAAISLFIGGVGIMNIMLLTVTERMHEIGVRKAIGATNHQILAQFITEAAVLSVMGGIIGIVLSLAVTGVLYVYTDLKPVISWQAIVIATGVSLTIGVLFGAIPAVKAARKDPIEALRHE